MKNTNTKQTKVEVPRDVEVQSKIEVAHSAALQVMGKELIKQVGIVGEKYLQICEYIRKNKVAPKLVSHELGVLGFKRSRVSEINRVANASDELWGSYQAKALSFKNVLELSRAEPGKEGQRLLTTAGQTLAESGHMSAEELDEVSTLEGTPRESGGTSGSSPAQKLKAAAKFLCMNSKSVKTWKFDDCKFVVHVVKAKHNDQNVTNTEG